MSTSCTARLVPNDLSSPLVTVVEMFAAQYSERRTPFSSAFGGTGSGRQDAGRRHSSGNPKPRGRGATERGLRRGVGAEGASPPFFMLCYYYIVNSSNCFNPFALGCSFWLLWVFLEEKKSTGLP